MYVSDMRPTLIAGWPMRNKMALGFLGEPGIGKTQEVYAFANWVRENTEFKECKVVEYILSQALPSEISGITMPNVDEQSLAIYDHQKLLSLKDGDILFLDEFLEAPEQVRKACLTLIQERRMMSGRMLPDIMIIAASNPCNPERISLAQRERFKWFNIEFSFPDWVDWIVNKYPIKNQNQIEELWRSCSRFDNTEWNTATPRSLTTMIEWYSRCPNEETQRAIQRLYGISAAKSIAGAFTTDVLKDKTIDFIDDVLGNLSPCDEDAQELIAIKKALVTNTFSAKKAASKMQDLECWPTIKKLMKEVMVEDVKKEEVINETVVL